VLEGLFAKSSSSHLKKKKERKKERMKFSGGATDE